jgi:hypothetical protein
VPGPCDDQPNLLFGSSRSDCGLAGFGVIDAQPAVLLLQLPDHRLLVMAKPLKRGRSFIPGSGQRNHKRGRHDEQSESENFAELENDGIARREQGILETNKGQHGSERRRTRAC